MTAAAALLYGLGALAAILFQLALALGAPWGRLAMGGRWPGRLPPALRLAALAQAALLGFFALVVLGRAGLVHPPPPGWLFWLVAGLSALSAAMNLATPSIPERRLWGPVALLLLVSALAVGLG